MKRLKSLLFLFLVLATSVCLAKEYHVSVKGSNSNESSVANPFKTINHAAQLAMPGDVITVHAGTYREWINPARGGESDTKRIVYQAATGENVEIMGSESDANTTTIWANFQKSDPGKALIEISTRRTCFYPGKPGVNFITIRGFNISQAATQWAAPTAEQIGMISTHWNKGWIIESQYWFPHCAKQRNL